MWTPNLKFKPGIFSDAGYRYRLNTFDSNDHWIPGVGHGVKKFYDVINFSSDEIEVDDDYMIIAQMYFRIKVDTIRHERRVFSISDWLGSIGGIKTILLDLFIIFFGSFSQFNAVIATFNSYILYKQSKFGVKDGEEDEILDLSTLT